MLMKIVRFLILAIACIGMWTTVSWAGVTVYAEGAYTDSDLVVYLYVDVQSDPILSYGVKLTYDPLDLGSPLVEKNDGDWYFGEKSSPYPTNNANPDTSTPGEVVIVGGKLDSATPQAGVTGNRVLLGKISFSRLTENLPSAELYLGKGGNYSNFVQVNGVELDHGLAGDDKIAPIGAVAIYQRGDANGDGVISGADRSTVKYYMVNGSYFSPWVDCNGDGNVSGADRSCIQYLMTH